MKRTLFLSLFLAHSTHSPAADPAWWASRSVVNGSAASNLSPATVGQAKHMVSQALAELQTRLDAPTYQAIQTDVAAVMSLALPVTPADFEKQRSVLLIGQLKAISAPFYSRLYQLYPAWVETRLAENLTKDLGNPANFYPWTSSVADDSNKGIATLGQLKAVFALPLENLPPSSTDVDGDSIPDSWEILYFGNLGQIRAS
jgi:hypothetical protein